jgi:hypothetical protein
MLKLGRDCDEMYLNGVNSIKRITINGSNKGQNDLGVAQVFLFTLKFISQ